MSDRAEPDRSPRAGRCAIVGRPNVGKSTLLNAVVGQKLAITTERPGTTRACVLGVLVSADPLTQIAFVDTPGVARPRTALHRVLVDEARGGMLDADVMLFLTEVGRRAEDGIPEADMAVLEAVKQASLPTILAINKVDRVRHKRRLLPLMDAFGKAHPMAAIVPISARHGTNLEVLLAEIRQLLPEGWMYDDKDFLTDRPERFLAGELVREAVMRHTRDEVPYGVAVGISEFTQEGSLVRISVTIVVEKESQRGIVIGAGGSLLKTIGTEARVAIEELLGRRVHLSTWVKVMPGWTRNPDVVRRLTAGSMP